MSNGSFRFKDVKLTFSFLLSVFMVAHSLFFFFFFSFGSALHFHGFRAFSASQKEGLLSICSTHIIIIIINIFNATTFLHHKVKLFNLLLLLALQHKFAPRAPPRLVPKKEVKTYGLFCLMIVYGVVQLDLMLLFFCFCSEVIEDAAADANQAKDLLRRFNVYVTLIWLVSHNYFTFLWFYISLLCCVGECYEGKEQGWEKRFAMLLKFFDLIVFVFLSSALVFWPRCLFFSLLEINHENRCYLS